MTQTEEQARLKIQPVPEKLNIDVTREKSSEPEYKKIWETMQKDAEPDTQEIQSNDTGGEISISAGIFIVAGALVGLLVVRSFMLEPIEEMGWRMFWHALSQGNIDRSDMGKIFGSSTFGKSAVGVIVGGVVGFFAREAYRPSKQQN